MKTLAIITARGGSKRIPKKNIKDFLGKPIIAYSIRAAIDSGIFDEIMVSTDNEEIAEIAKKMGANVPFFRNENTSDDYATTADVISEVLETYSKTNQEFNYACCIYPTAPFINAAKLINAFKLLKDKNCDSVIPITEFSFPILRSLKLSENSTINFNWPEYAFTRSQDLQKAFHDCGQFYFFNVPIFKKTKKLISGNTCGIVMPNSEVQDIDTGEDWKMAEIKYSFLVNKI